jgi:glycosyltransferase involved in cell wall biosynthesis
LVSILLLVHIGEIFLAECMSSILVQDFTDFELMVSDEGSWDGSVALTLRSAQRASRLKWASCHAAAAPGQPGFLLSTFHFPPPIRPLRPIRGHPGVFNFKTEV